MVKIFKIKDALEPMFVFMTYGIMFSTWFVYIPFVKIDLQITQFQLAFAIFSMSAAGLIALLFCPLIIKKLGSSNATKIIILAFTISIASLPFSRTYTDLCVRMFIVGLLASSSNVAMNSLVLSIESKLNINIMSTCHACFSLGCIIGSGIGSFVILVHLPKILHLLTLVILLGTTILCGLKTSDRSTKQVESNIEPQSQTVFSWIYVIKMLVPVMIIYFIMMSEGAMADWGGLYIRNIIAGPSWSYSLAYGMFSVAMCIGRFGGDKLANIFRTSVIIKTNLIIALSGLILILVKFLLISLLGFFLTGVGFSLLIPIVYRTASQNTDAPSRAIAILSGAGSIGFLTGPLIFGFLGNWKGLTVSFVFILISVAFCFFLVLIESRPKRSSNSLIPKANELI